MSDPIDPSQPPPRNPPGARRRGRRPRAVPIGEPAEAEPAPAPAPPPAAATTAPDAAKPARPATKDDEKPASAPSRGMVCPHCGKYHDITTRRIGGDFECRCGATLTVPPLRQNTVTRPPELTLRLRELRTRNRLAMVSMLIAFTAGLALLAAALYLLVTERSYVSGTCAGIAALAFLCVAILATSEWRSSTAQLAAERPDDA